jgi:hypothetical protein
MSLTRLKLRLWWKYLRRRVGLWILGPRLSSEEELVLNAWEAFKGFKQGVGFGDAALEFRFEEPFALIRWRGKIGKGGRGEMASNTALGPAALQGRYPFYFGQTMGNALRETLRKTVAPELADNCAAREEGGHGKH